MMTSVGNLRETVENSCLVLKELLKSVLLADGEIGLDQSVTRIRDDRFVKAAQRIYAYNDTGEGVALNLSMGFRPIPHEAPINKMGTWQSLSLDPLELFHRMANPDKMQAHLSRGVAEQFSALTEAFLRRESSILDEDHP